MEGVLWKWTNYWNGWQTRWFVLENGILSYYKSQDEVSQGCKGSFKVSACQINVNIADSTRLSLSIPGHNHMHLRAPSAQERQRWVVALGSAKACFVDLVQADSKDSIDNPNSLIHKKSELRLYCDLIMQQVHEVKEISNSKNIDQQKLDQVSSLLGASCDTFIRSLEDCMKMINLSHSTVDIAVHSANGSRSSINSKNRLPLPPIVQETNKQNCT